MKTPKAATLLVILIVTSLIGLAVILPTLALFYLTVDAQNTNLSLSIAALHCVLIVGFALLLGDFVAFYLKLHSLMFWVCSSMLNFALSGSSFYLIFYHLTQRAHYHSADSQYSAHTGLFVIWTLYVALASLYYARFARVSKFEKLP